MPVIDETVTISVAARQLSPRERRVLGLRFLSDMTQTQIAQEIGVSQMQVSRILRHALSRMSELAHADEDANGAQTPAPPRHRRGRLGGARAAQPPAA